MSHFGTSNIIALTLFGSLAINPGAAAAEDDHLICAKPKDSEKAKVEATIQMTTPFAGPSRTCVVKSKASLVCYPSERDAGDDVNGGPIDATLVCYKLKCTIPGAIDLSHAADTAFADHQLTIKPRSFKFGCVPATF